ncbi:MAG TPA: hypothetical protein VFO77_05635 [Actinoplanes sp.]|nr:hypothetical protein [Actinoplanes sp.]
MGLRKKKTLLEQAEGYVGAAIDQARDFVQDTALPAISDAKEKAAPVVAAGAATVAEKASEAKVKAAPVVAAGAATVAAKAAEAKGYAETKAAELNGSQPKKRSKVKTLLILGAVGGGVAVIAKKLQGSAGDSGGWQSSYDPAPPPSPAASVPPPAPDPGTVADTGADSGADTAATPEAADPLTDPLPTETPSETREP